MKALINELIDILKENKEQHLKAAEKQCALWEGRRLDSHPLLLSCSLEKSLNDKIPLFNAKEIHYDKDKMLMYGLKALLQASLGGCDAVPSLRAHMGCGIYPTLLGVKQELFEDKNPWVTGHMTKEELSKMGPEDIKLSDDFKIGLEHMQYLAEKIEGTGCRVFPMDLQGAYDTAHIVYGNGIFYDMYDDPDFIHHLLDLSCHAIIMGMEECIKIIPESDKMIAHYNNLVIPRSKGGLKISEDTSTLISKEQLEEFVIPYMNRILEHFGGGYVHYCGKNDHLFEAAVKQEKAYAMNFGNPEKHDMETVLERCAEEGKLFYGGGIIHNENESYEEYFKRILNASRTDNGYILLKEQSCSLDEREEIIEAWQKAQEQVESIV